MSNDYSRVRGDSGAMPDRSTGTNVPGNAADGGRDLGPSAKNRLGPAHMPSDPPEQDKSYCSDLKK